MKITKDDLKKLIKEELEEAGKVDLSKSSKAAYYPPRKGTEQVFQKVEKIYQAYKNLVESDEYSEILATSGVDYTIALHNLDDVLKGFSGRRPQAVHKSSRKPDWMRQK
jgi:aspartate/methionine/tyrosine aminotransferase